MTMEAVTSSLLYDVFGYGAWSVREALRLVLLSVVFTAVCLRAFPSNAPTRRLLLLAAVVTLALLPAFLLSFDAVWLVAMTTPPVFTLAAPLPNVALAIWLVIAAILVVRHLIRVRAELREVAQLPDLVDPRLERALASLSAPIPPPRLKLGDRACATTLGPATIVLPNEWLHWDERTLASVLAHELTHVARRDDRWLLCTRLVVLFYWWMPWLLALYRVHVRTMEESCDDAASELVGAQHAYVAALVDASGKRGGAYRSVANMHEHHLVGRVGRFLRIRDVELDTGGVYWWVIGVGFVVVCLTGFEPSARTPTTGWASAMAPAISYVQPSATADAVTPESTAAFALGVPGMAPQISQYWEVPQALSAQARVHLMARLNAPVDLAPVIYPGVALRDGVEGRVIAEFSVGRDGTADWLANIGDAFNIAPDKIAAAQNAFLPAIQGALAGISRQIEVDYRFYE